MPKYETQEQALRAVDSWRLGIIFHTELRIIAIPKDAVIGLRRLGTLDYLASKCEWIILRNKGR